MGRAGAAYRDGRDDRAMAGGARFAGCPARRDHGRILPAAGRWRLSPGAWPDRLEDAASALWRGRLPVAARRGGRRDRADRSWKRWLRPEPLRTAGTRRRRDVAPPLGGSGVSARFSDPERIGA